MNFKALAAAAALAFGALASAPASAVVVSGYSGAPGTTVDDFSATGLVSFDLNMASAQPATRITFTVESGDVGGLLDFNAIVNNLFGAGISHFSLRLDNALFAAIGSVDDGGFGSSSTAGGSGGNALIDFALPEFNFFSIGDPFADGATDWSISIAGLRAGDTFSLTAAAVPEPGSLPLLLVGLVGAAALGRKYRAKA